MSRTTALLWAALILVTATLYTTRLGDAPPYLMHDELQFALQAEAIASSGRDLAGHLLPVFFVEPEFPAGRDPAAIYVTAAALTWLPFSEASVRLPTALVGVLCVGLMFLLARRLFGRDSLALLAAAFLALTPAHFIRSRLLLSPHYALPFVLAWLLWLAAFTDQPSTRRLTVATVWLGLGMYTYLACVVMMPVYLMLTLAVAYHVLGRRAAAMAGAAFVVPLIPMAWWYATHPARVEQIVGAYQLGTAAATVPIGVAAALQSKLALFWSFFNPDYLFLSGDSSLINSTRLAGFFPLSFAVLLPFGALRLVQARSSIALVILVGLVTAPLAAVVTGAIEMNRVMFAIPFGVLAAAHGAASLLASPSRIWRAVALLLVIAVPMQFAGFHRDYLGRYRVQAGPWFGGNTRDAMTAAMAGTAAGSDRRIYLSRAIPFGDRYWRFYILTAGRPDLTDRVVYYGPGRPDGARIGELLVCPAADPDCQAMRQDDSGWEPVKTVRELDGTPSFELLEWRRP